LPNVIEVRVVLWDEIYKIQRIEGLPQVFETGRRGGEMKESWDLG